MKTIFIINPAAGRRSVLNTFIQKAQKALSCFGDSVTLYCTKEPKDATRFVKEYCEKNGAARFIACGGDGTFQEVLEGIEGVLDAEVGIMPFGTGNDFYKNFSQNDAFLSMKAQVNGEAVYCDKISYKTTVNGSVRQGFCANMFNIGFDCRVADKTKDLKKIPLLFGPFAYFVSILYNLLSKKGEALDVVADGKCVHSGPLLLTSVANGSYCGGGIKSNPDAKINDGLIDLNIIKNVSRRKFISLLPAYMKGTFRQKKGFDTFAAAYSCKTITITPHSGIMRLCVDGEIADAGQTVFTIVPNAFRFVIPKEEFNREVRI